MLRENLKGIPNVNLFEVALGDENTKATFYIPQKFSRETPNFGTLRKGRGPKRTITVELRTLDSFGFNNVGLIKVDTEGNELNILKGATETLKKQMPQLILEIHSPLHENARLITQLLKTLGYRNLKYVCKADAAQIFIVAQEEK